MLTDTCETHYTHTHTIIIAKMIRAIRMCVQYAQSCISIMHTYKTNVRIVDSHITYILTYACGVCVPSIPTYNMTDIPTHNKTHITTYHITN